MVKQWVVIALAVSAPALAQTPLRSIGGGVYEDRPALALRTHFTPLKGVTVKLYADGGDAAPSADDALVDTATTNEAGLYVFRISREGDYWVAIDSRTARGGELWAEQTFGPARGLCARPDGTTVRIPLEGACFGGRTAASDNAAALATSEHVAGVSLRGAQVLNVDFGFSFNVITVTGDGERVQGSLRQFIHNANAVTGGNRSHFVPITPAVAQTDTIVGVPPRWWTITLGTPLPEIRDAETALDGTAHSFLSPSTMTDVHPGRINERPTMAPNELRGRRQENPELEIVVTGSEGIVCTALCGIRALAVRGAPVAVLLRADSRLEHVMVGAAPDREFTERGTVGVQIERGTTIARDVYVTAQSNVGIFVAAEARLDAERLDVSRCGEPLAGGGIVLLSNGSSIRSSNISANPGAGIVIGQPDTNRAANGNTLDSNVISSNQAGIILSPGASRNVITRNDLMWNRLGGVTVTPFKEVIPRENRLTANRYDENGVRPIVLNLAVENPNALARSDGTCERAPNVPNNGILPPNITSAQLISNGDEHRVVIRGRACPGEVVEIYQSYVTAAVREKVLEMPRIRGDQNPERETIATDQRMMALPSIGEFNYFGTTNTAADGTFEATFPFHVVVPTVRAEITDLYTEGDLWAREVLRGADPTERAFSAVAIDTAGNTSEMSVRRQVDR